MPAAAKTAAPVETVDLALAERRLGVTLSLEENPMLYLFLICYDPTRERRPDEPASRQAEHAALEAELRQEGVFVAGAALMPPAIVPPVIVRDGKRVPATEGPFAESRELLGGFFIIDCNDDDDAARQASRIPTDSRSWIRAQRIPLYHPGSGTKHDADMQALERGGAER